MKRLILLAICAAAFISSASVTSAGHHHHRRCCCWTNCCSACFVPTSPTAFGSPQPAGAPPKEKLNVIGHGRFTTASGKTFDYVDVVDDSSFHDEVRRSGTARMRALTPRAGAAAPGTGDDFEGTDRGAAKTTPVQAAVEQFGDLQQLLVGLRPDDEMRSYDPSITEAWDSPRVAEEQRNVTVDAYLYAAKEETDNDFHMLIGRGPNETSGTYMMNAEISGLPAEEPQRTALEQPRQQFRNFLQWTPPRTTYRRLPQPIHVRITGSLFYDIDHKPGVVGTGNWKPSRSWEIHPVTDIQFEP